MRNYPLLRLKIANVPNSRLYKPKEEIDYPNTVNKLKWPNQVTEGKRVKAGVSYSEGEKSSHVTEKLKE